MELEEWLGMLKGNVTETLSETEPDADPMPVMLVLGGDQMSVIPLITMMRDKQGWIKAKQMYLPALIAQLEGQSAAVISTGWSRTWNPDTGPGERQEQVVISVATAPDEIAALCGDIERREGKPPAVSEWHRYEEPGGEVLEMLQLGLSAAARKREG